MTSETTEINQNLSLTKLICGIIFHPVKIWKIINEKKTFKYMWLLFFICIEIFSIPYIFAGVKNFIFGLFLLNVFCWLFLMIFWLNFIIGLKVAGIRTEIPFSHLVRFFSYNNIISFIILPFYIILAILCPDLFALKETPYKNIENIYNLFDIILTILIVIWFLILQIISIKQVYKVESERAAVAVLFCPICIAFLIGSTYLIVKIF